MTTDFQTAFETFLNGAQAICSEYRTKEFPTLPEVSLKASKGGRYVKVIRVDGASSSVHCFVDTTNGDVLKAASYKAPAKHARGNIYAADNGLGCMGPYGAAYLR